MGQFAGMRGAAGTPLVANTPAAAMALADDLARLIDDMTTREVGWDKFDDLVRADGPISTITGNCRCACCRSCASGGRGSCRSAARSSRPRAATS